MAGLEHQRQRRGIAVFVFVAILCLGLSAGTSVTGTFNTSVNMKNTPVGPVQLGLNGAVGEMRDMPWLTTATAPSPTATAPSPNSAPLDEGTADTPSELSVIGQNPFNGPNAEEAEVLRKLQHSYDLFMNAMVSAFEKSTEAMKESGKDLANVEDDPDVGRTQLKRKIDQLIIGQQGKISAMRNVPKSVFRPLRHLTKYELDTMRQRTIDLNEATTQLTSTS